MTAAMGSACDVSGAAHLPAEVAAPHPAADRRCRRRRDGAAARRLRAIGRPPRRMLEALLKSFGEVASVDAAVSRALWRAVRDVTPFAASGGVSSGRSGVSRRRRIAGRSWLRRCKAAQCPPPGAGFDRRGQLRPPGGCRDTPARGRSTLPPPMAANGVTSRTARHNAARPKRRSSRLRRAISSGPRAGGDGGRPRARSLRAAKPSRCRRHPRPPDAPPARRRVRRARSQAEPMAIVIAAMAYVG